MVVEEEEHMSKLSKLVALIVLAACYVTLLGSFTRAYISPLKLFKIGINIYGEANLEAAILLLSFPLCVKYLWEQLKSLR